MSVAVAALWVACFVLTYTFPFLNKNFGAAWTFWIYAAICAGDLLFIRQRLPETKGNRWNRSSRCSESTPESHNDVATLGIRRLSGV
jgi:hypothetical protein